MADVLSNRNSCVVITSPRDANEASGNTKQPASNEVVVLREPPAHIRAEFQGKLGRDMIEIRIPCSDCVGLVTSIGSDVKSFSIGDRACPLFFPYWKDRRPDTAKTLRGALGGKNVLEGGMKQGVLRTRFRCRAQEAVKIPTYLTDAEASTLPCAGVTAWSALMGYETLPDDINLSQSTPNANHKRLEGKVVLVQGTGAVSMFALQFAKALGARVIATSSSNVKLQIAKKMGADLCINYKTIKKWGKQASSATIKKFGRTALNAGADLIVEVGGAGTISESLDAVRIGGVISMVGNLSGRSGEIKRLDRIFYKAVRIQGVVVGHKKGFLDMLQVMESHRINPVVGQIYPISKAAKAFSGDSTGATYKAKVMMGNRVIRVSDSLKGRRMDSRVESRVRSML
ncbi:hypothetical protein AAMO2058_000045600 [Amorphochlora amoebiformis]